MNGSDLIALGQLTLRDPRTAARTIIAQALPRDVLWTALALVAAINTGVIVVLLALSPPGVPLPDYFNAPLALFVLLAGTSVVFVHAIYWGGLALGGKGALNDVLALVVWLLALRAVAQLGVMVLTLLLPLLALVASLVIAVWGIWIMLNFIAEALTLPSLMHAIAVLIIASVGLVLGLGLLLSFFGLGAQGVASNV